MITEPITQLETYGKRIVWKNPFKRKTGWRIHRAFAESYGSIIRRLEGY